MSKQPSVASPSPDLPNDSFYRFTGRSRLVDSEGRDSTGPKGGQYVWEIEAAREIAVHSGTIPAGRRGGWIAGPQSLLSETSDQDVFPWVEQNAVVLGRVSGSAAVLEDSFLDPRSSASGNAKIVNSRIIESSVDNDAMVVNSRLQLSNVNFGKVEDSQLLRSVIGKPKGQVANISVLKSALDETAVTGGAVEGSRLTACRIKDMTKVTKSELTDVEGTGASLIHKTQMYGAAVHASVVDDSRLNHIFLESSKLRDVFADPDGDGPVGGAEFPCRIRDSEIERCTIKYDPEVGTHIKECLLANVNLHNVAESMFMRDIRQADTAKRLTIDRHLSPMAAEYYLASLKSDEDKEAPLPDGVTFLRDLPESASEDAVRLVLVAAVTARDPNVMRYLDTIAAHSNQDIGIIETIVRQPSLRSGMVDALRTMPGVVVSSDQESTFLSHDSPALQVRDELNALTGAIYQTRIGQMNEGLWPNIRVPKPVQSLPSEEVSRRHFLSRSLKGGPPTPVIIVDGEPTPVIPILLDRHHLHDDETGWRHVATDGQPVIRPDARGGRLYEPAFVDQRSMRFGPEHMRFLTVASPGTGTANGIAFKTQEGAADYLNAVLAAHYNQKTDRDPARRDHWPESERVDTSFSPVLTRVSFLAAPADAEAEIKRIDLSADFAADMPEVAVTFRASIPPEGKSDPTALVITAAHSGHQAAIIRPKLGVGPHEHGTVLHTAALDGAVATSEAALVVAKARHERGREWTFENRPAFIAEELQLAQPKPAQPRSQISMSRD